MTPKTPILLVKVLGFLKRTEILGQHRILIPVTTLVKILGYFIRSMFFDVKNPWRILLVKILGFLKSTEILGLCCIKMSGKSPVKILGYFRRTIFLTPKKNPWPIFACRNLGTFKKYKDIGLTSYQNCRISTCHNLAVFQHFKRTMFLSPKTHLTPVEILGYFLRTRLFTPKTHCLCGLSTSWAAFKEYRDIGPKTYPNPSFNICQNLGLFHNNDDF